MELSDLQKTWNRYAKADPFFEILSYPGKKGFRWNKNEFFSTGINEINGVLKAALELGIGFQRKRALDFGCGVGRLTFAMATHFEEVLGIDISPQMIKLAEGFNPYGERCRFLLNASEKIPQLRDSSFDFIYTSLTLQHIEPRFIKSYIKELVRILSRKGLLVFQLPVRELTRTEKIFRALKRFNLKNLLIYLTPKLVLDAYLDLKFRDEKPKVEMYGIEKDEIIRDIEEAGGRVVESLADDSQNLDWISLRYFVTK